MSDKFQVDAWWASAKVVFIEDDYAQIENNFSCALAVESRGGTQFFLCQKINLQDGSEYVLERYDFEKQTLFYRRRKS